MKPDREALALLGKAWKRLGLSLVGEKQIGVGLPQHWHHEDEWITH